jgi:hypothetical protein
VWPVNIEIPLRVYDGFVDKCDQASPEYAILKNGIIRRKDDQYERLVEICCNLEDADTLLILAAEVYPDAVEYIKRGIVASFNSD